MITPAFVCECDECGHVWLHKEWVRPEQCAKCKSRNWNSLGKRRRLDKILAEHKAVIDALPLNTDFTSYNSHKELAAICHAAVHAAIKIGAITKPTECSRCTEPNRIYQLVAHHCDYSKPLEIEWLCGPCHSEYHWNQGHRKHAPRKEAREMTYVPDIEG